MGFGSAFLVACIGFVASIASGRAVSDGLKLREANGDPEVPLQQWVASSCLDSGPALNPFYEVRYGQDVVWQIPANPKAVLFVAHGLNMQAVSFFDPGPNCPKCTGMPEERVLVGEALKRGYAVILVKSVGRIWEPETVEAWPPPDSEDREIVTKVMKEWAQEHSVDHLPIAALGHSAGGNFSTLLAAAKDLEFKSLVCMCAPGALLALENADSSFPPTLFVSMPKDAGKIGFYQQAVRAIRILATKGVQVGQFNVWPVPISPLYFSRKIPCLDDATSEGIFLALKADGWVDADHFLIKDPTESDWRSVLLKHGALPLCDDGEDLCFGGQVGRALKSAFAVHSVVSRANAAVYGWLDSTLFSNGSAAE